MLSVCGRVGEGRAGHEAHGLGHGGLEKATVGRVIKAMSREGLAEGEEKRGYPGRLSEFSEGKFRLGGANYLVWKHISWLARDQRWFEGLK